MRYTEMYVAEKAEKGYSFMDTYGNRYRTFTEMVRKAGIENEADPEPEFDDSYRVASYFAQFVTTKTVMSFCESHNCYWLLDVIASYQYVSNTLARIDRQGHINWYENPEGKDNCIICHLQRTTGTMAVFTMDILDEETGEEYTEIYQNIEFTDIDVDNVTLDLENGVLCFLTER